MVKWYLLIIVLIVSSTNSFSKRKRKPLSFGGSIGLVLPSDLGTSDELGFNDVASTGFSIEADSRWYYSQRLSLGANISYSFTPQDDQFWNLRNYGTTDNYYRMLQFAICGHYYFSDDELKPYMGVGFGAFLLMNQLIFSSNYYGSDSYESVSYTTSHWKPSFYPEVGFMYELSKNTNFFMNLRFQVIPNMKPTTVEVYDNIGTIIDWIVQNPHGHQNHFVLSAGLLF